MSEVLIKADHVSKKFCRSLRKSLRYGVQDIASEILGGSRDHVTLRPEEFWALRDISFELRRGECLGLIGRNGAGKTTLLKILNALIKPDQGRIEIRGRVGALIALGAGFNPILSGRENIYVNGSILGLKKREIEDKIDDIIDFADLADFIDSPVQSYSSGMQVRLGFAIATALQPDILLLDEVLAVGDAGFRAKCYSRLARIHEKAAVILVSHDVGYIAQMCDRVLCFERGVATTYHDVMEGIRAYNANNQTTLTAPLGATRMFYPIEDGGFEINRNVVNYAGSLEVILRVVSSRPLQNPLVSFVASNEAGQEVLCWHSNQFDVDITIPGGASELRFTLEPLWLHSGRYDCSIMIVEGGSIEHILWFEKQASFRVETGKKPVSNIPLLMPYRGHTVTLLSVTGKAGSADHGAEKSPAAIVSGCH